MAVRLITPAAALRERTRLAIARARLPIPSLEPAPTDGLAQRQEQIRIDVAKVDVDIRVETEAAESLSRQWTKLIESGVSTSSERGALDDKMADSRRLLKNLHRARSDIQKGFTFESAVSRATQIAAAAVRRRAAKREAVEVVTKEPTAAELRGFEKAGLKPIFERGELVGFSDEVRMLSFPTKFLGELEKSRLDILEREGLVTITEVEEPKVTPFFPPTPPLTVEVAKTQLEQLERLIQESTPELGLPIGQLKFVTETLIGTGLGTFKFLKFTAQGQLTKLKDIEGKSIFTPTQAKNIVNIVERAIPKTERGLVEALALEREIERPPVFPILPTELITFDIIQPTGIETTAVLTAREKTFFEKVGIDPKARESIELKGEFERIQLGFDEGVLTETQASVQLEEAKDKFTSVQIVKGIPASAALGAVAFFLGPIAQTALGADMILKRDQVITQFIRFPKESALSTAAFMAGGLVGARIRTGIRTKVSDIKLDTTNLDSATFLSGVERTRLVDTAQEVFPQVRVLIKSGKVTDTIAYDIKLKDGKVFKVIEFSKLLETGRIDKQFFGFEMLEKGRIITPRKEAFIGRGVGTIKGPKAELFIRAIKFKHANTPLGRFVQKNIGSGRLIDLVERSQLIKVKQQGRIRATQIRSVAGILRSTFHKSNLIREISKFIDDVGRGKTISTLRLKKLINLNRQLQGKKPFTEAEFQATKIRALTDIQVINILTKLKVNFERVDIAGLKTLSQKASLEAREVVAGRAITKVIKVPEKVPVRKPITPFRVTFPRVIKEPAIIARARQLAKLRPFSKLKRVKGEIKQVETAASVSAAALIALSKLDRQRIVAVPFFSGGPLSREFGLTPQGVTNSLGAVITNLGSVERSIIRIRSIPKISSFLQNKLTFLEKQKLALETKQRVLNKLLGQMKTKQVITPKEATALRSQLALRQALQQRLKLKQKQRLREIFEVPRVIPKIPRLKIPPPFILVKEIIAKKKKLIKVPLAKGGYNVFVKSKGKFKKVNINPLSKKKAHDLGSWLVDRSTSRTWKRKQVGFKAQKPILKVPSDYFKKTIKKYRGKKVKGKVQPLINLGIEKRKFAIDTPREKKQLSAARVRAELLRKLGLKKPRKIPRRSSPKLKSTKLIKLKKKKR